MTSDGWIAVADALPENEGRYLVFMTDVDQNDPLMDVAWYFPGKGWPEVRARAITHWQPLPEPPRP